MYVNEDSAVVVVVELVGHENDVTFARSPKGRRPTAQSKLDDTPNASNFAPASRCAEWTTTIGMGLMAGGIWGVGFAIVDMRIRQLLKRFLRTPMKKSHFVAAMMFSR